MRSWVAFSVVDEDGAGSVCVGDLKARRCNTSVIWVVFFHRKGFNAAAVYTAIIATTHT